jgi:hypothetical protein
MAKRRGMAMGRRSSCRARIDRSAVFRSSAMFNREAEMDGGAYTLLRAQNAISWRPMRVHGAGTRDL